MDLWRIAEEEIRERGLGITPDCEAHLRYAIDGAQVQAHQFTDREGEIEQNLRLLVRTMVQIARENNYTELRERTFFGALERLCPLFPFC